MEKPKELAKKQQFVLVTNDYSGLGFVLQEILQGGDVVIAFKPKEPPEKDKKEAYDVQGQGIVKSYSLEELFAKRAKLKDAYWVFDGNHNVDYGEKLIKEGFKVWNGSQLQFDLENDRAFGLKFAEEAGLHSPPFKEFKNIQDGVKFLEENEDKAYVFKPDGEDSHLTQPFSMTPEPKSANIEARKFIQNMGINEFILQERKKGIEVNTEIFFSKGEPILAQANLECKRRHNGDKGYMTGCAMDVCWEVPLDSQLVKMTAGKFIPKMKELKYTGFCDTNVIISDDLDVWFLEFCFRTGYNSHPNYFTTIAKKTYLQTIADLIDGKGAEAKKGFGASVTLFTDKEHKGIPIYVSESLNGNFYLFDGFKSKDDKEGEYSMGGWGNEIAIITGHNYTIATAFQDALENADRVKFVNKDYRTDGDKTDYQTSPIRRYEALQSMKLI